jgi:hypothetical protein
LQLPAGGLHHDRHLPLCSGMPLDLVH